MRILLSLVFLGAMGCAASVNADDRTQAQTLQSSLAQRGSAKPFAKPGTTVLRAILGTGQPAPGEERTIEADLEILFNQAHEVGWLNELGEFQTQAAAGQARAHVTLFPGTKVDLAIRDTVSGAVTLASANPSRIVPLDTQPATLGRQPVPTGPYATRWVATFDGAPVVVVIDAKLPWGKPQRGGNGIEKFTVPAEQAPAATGR